MENAEATLKESSVSRMPSAERLFLITAGFTATMLAHVVRFGYDFGNSDQDELLPAVYRVLSKNTLFSSDWLVSYQTSAFNVRTPTISIIANLSSIFSTFDAVLLLYVLSAVGSFLAIYRIASRSGETSWTPWLSGLAIFVLTKGFTLGGNDVMNSMYVPSMTGWAISLWSVFFWLSDRPVVAGILAAVTVPFQALIGLQTALMLGLGSVILLISSRDMRHLTRVLQFSFPFLIMAAWPIYLLLSAQATGSTLVDGIGASGDPFLEVLARIRAPHHFMPTHFPVRSVLKFASLSGLGAVAFAIIPQSADRGKFLAILGAIVICCVLAFGFSEIWPLAIVVKMQLFRLTVYAKIILVIVLFQAVLLTLRSGLRAGSGEHYSTLWRRASLVVVASACLFAASQLPAYEDLAFNIRSQSPWGQVESWAESSTDLQSVFIVPPSSSDFRSNARRAIFVNYKAVPFSPSYLREWQTRIEVLSGTDILPDGVSMDWLDRAYGKLEASDVASIIDDYDIDYVVRVNEYSGIEPVFVSGELRVYSAESILSADRP